MKTLLRKSSLILAFLLLTVGTAMAQRGETVQIKTTGECEMCKKSIEKEMGLTKGVKKANLDVESHILTVTYNPKKVTLDEIRQHIAHLGYDADDVHAENKAFNKLPECCRKNSGKTVEEKKVGE